MKAKSTGICLAISAIIAAGGIWLLVKTRAQTDEAPTSIVLRKKMGADSKNQLEDRRKRREAIRMRMEGMRAGLSLSTNGAPTLVVMDEIERQTEGELDEMQRQVLRELDLALLHDDRPTAIARINRFLKMLASAKNISPEMRVQLRRHIVKAAGWIGGEAVPEIIPFLADEDASVRELAMNQFEQALWDFSLGDREVAQIVIAASQVLTDTEALDSILFNIDIKMRRSVGVDTILEIANSGTAEAKALLPDEIISFTGDDTIETEEDLLRWKEDHPDREDDEEFYGPQKEF